MNRVERYAEANPDFDKMLATVAHKSDFSILEVSKLARLLLPHDTTFDEVQAYAVSILRETYKGRQGAFSIPDRWPGVPF